MSQPIYHYFRSLYTTADQVRLWLASKDLDNAALWVRERDLLGSYDTPFVHEREEVAHVRFLLATFEPAVALQRLEPVLGRAATGQRWRHVFEIYLLQALAHQMCGEEEQALSALSEAVRLAEPEGYIRSFVDEGPSMAALLSQLREQQQKSGATPYLDTILAAFPPQGKARKCQRKQDKVAMH
jgi:LuxR family maltose regulon positive regulatory protein